MSITVLSGCGNHHRQQTNNDCNYQNSEGGIINAITGNKSTSNGSDQPESTYERKGGLLGLFLGDVRKTNGPVSSGTPKHTRKPGNSSGSGHSSSKKHHKNRVLN